MSNKKRTKKSKKNFQNEDDNMSSYSEQSGSIGNSTFESMGISAAVALALDPLTEASPSSSFDTQQSNVPSFGDEFIALSEEPTVSRQERRFEYKKQGRSVKRIPKANDCDFDKCYPWPYEVNKLFDGREIHAYDLLRKDFNDFWVYITPRGAEAKLRRKIKEKYERIIQKVWPNATVSIFGSYVTGLYLPDSDMDMNISFSGRTPHIRDIASQLEREGLSYKTRVIGSATVPVIKLVDKKCGMKVDIVVNQSNGMYSAEIVNGYLREYPTARPLTRIIKYYLSQCDLNEVFTGGIGGYAIFALVVSFLQRHPLVASGQIDPKKNLPTLLLDFLALYGFHFNIDVAGISINEEGCYFYKVFIRERKKERKRKNNVLNKYVLKKKGWKLLEIP
ncbi:unnamed protein product [Rhizopus stolonifer]